MQGYPPGGPPPPPRPGSGMYSSSGQSGPYGYPQPPPVPQFYNPNAPPQPQWSNQPPPPAQDQQQQWHQGPPAPFPNQSPLSGYNPMTYGAMPGAQNSPISPVHYQATNLAPHGDTSRWGVKFNQGQQYGQQAEVKPPLPPRPPSAGNQSQSRPMSPQDFSTPQTQYSSFNSSVAPVSDDRPPWAHDPRYDSSRYSPSQAPPPPPPLPEGYQNELKQQNWPQQPHYSQQPPTYQYDPQSQGQGQPYSDYGQSQTYPPPSQSYNQQGSDYPGHENINQGVAPSVSPIEQSSSYEWSTNADESRPPYVSPPAPSHVDLVDPMSGQTGQDFSQQTFKYDYDSQGQFHPVSRPTSAFPDKSTPPVIPSASALGYGGPSDWEHFSPTVEDSQEYGFSVPSPEKVPDATPVAVELPSHPSPPLPPQVQEPAKSGQDETSKSSDAGAAAPPPLQLRQSSPAQRLPPTAPPNANTDLLKRVARADSVASVSTPTANNERSGSIDGVIQAWSEVHPVPAPAVSAAGIPETSSFRQDTAHPAPLNSLGNPSSIEHAPKKETHFVDPYGDMEPEYRASLARFVTMLRKEAVAITDEEKYKIFRSFLNREMKLREILYSIETPIRETMNKSANILDNNTHFQSTKLADYDATNRTTVVATKTPLPSQDGSAIVDNNSIPPSALLPQRKPMIDTSVSASDRTSDIDTTDGIQYSPGGRPMVSRSVVAAVGQNQPPPLSKEQRSLSLKTTPQATSRVADKTTVSPGANAPIVVDSTELTRSSSVPPAVARPPVLNNLPAIETNRPYTPFRYTEGPQRGSEQLTFDRPAYQAYSNLRQASDDSGRAMARTTSRAASKRREQLTSPSTSRRQHEETFLGMIRENGSENQIDEASTLPQPVEATQHEQPSEKPIDKSELDAVEVLKDLLPSQPFSSKIENTQISMARRKMETPPDDFSFIHDTVVAWDASYKPERARLERERHQRQEESEQRIDALFNDNEIGYSDIGNLEENFRREETDKKLLEDRRELESFKAKVFAVVDGRLKNEIDQFDQQYIDALNLLENSTAGQRMLENPVESPHISQAMQLVLTLFKKLEMRHQKRVEAVLERERRRRKIELALWYSLGDVASTKNLADEFEHEERNTLYKAAQEKDARANRLMDNFDRAIIRGLGDNQRLTESILEKIKGIKKDVSEGRLKQSEDLRTALNSTKSVLEALCVNSEACLQNFDIADKLLNEADYDVSVAGVGLEGGGAETLHSLEDAKKLEDVKIQDDLNERLGLVRKYSGETNALIRDIFELVGDPPEEASSPDTAVSDDLKRQERLKKALEEAKRRNAAKT